jgi:membrane associated rhomboid family serine protease
MVLSFPPFRGLTRQLVLWNIGIWFVLTVLSIAWIDVALPVIQFFVLVPSRFLHGMIWQMVTYSFVHVGGSVAAIVSVAAELLSLWFMGSLLEGIHGSRWLAEIYFLSVIGAGVAGVALAEAQGSTMISFAGCSGGLFGLLVAFGVLYGDMEFMMIPFPMMIKARYMAIIAGVIALAFLFSEERILAFSNLGGALFGFLYVKFAPRRGFAFVSSEGLFGLRNQYYRWKRRRAAKKFEVYMRKNRDN